LGRTKDWLEREEEAAAAQDAAAAEVESLRMLTAESEGRLALEREWAAKHPKEWAEWLRLQPLLFVDFGGDYGFQQFLSEVGPCPSPNQLIERLDDAAPYGPGNLVWQKRRATTAESQVKPPELSHREAAQYIGVSGDTLTKFRQRGFIGYRNASPPGSGKPLYRYLVADLDRFMREGYRRNLPRSAKTPVHRRKQTQPQTYEHLDLE
jgi:hypothetical protein